MQEDLFDKKDYKKFQNRFSVLPINTKPQSFIDVVSQAVPFYKQIDELLKREVDFSNKKDVEIITRLLTSSEHSKKDLQVLKKAFGELKFFKETQQNLPANDYTALINELKCEKFEQFETVFSYDDFGYKYYIILKGSVYVLIPNPETLKNQKQHPNQTDKKQQQANDSAQPIAIKNSDKQQSSRKTSVAGRKPSLNIVVQNELSEPSTPSPSKKLSSDRRRSIMKQQSSQFQQIALQQQQQQQQTPLQIEEELKMRKKNSFQTIQEFFEKDSEKQNEKEESGLTPQQLGALSQLKSKSLSPSKLNRRTTLGQPNLVSGIKKLQVLLKKGSAIEEEENEPVQDPQLTEQQIQSTVLQQNFGFDIIKTLKVGDAFGEIALMNNARRTASIICKEETIMVTLSKQSYDKILSNYHQKKFMESVNFLKEFSFFANWQNSKINGLYQNMEKRSVQYKEIIYREGDNADFVYFIKEGEFEVTKTLKIEQDSAINDQINSLLKQNKNSEIRKAKISVLGMGSSFGEEEIVMGTKRACGVQCISSTAVLYILPKHKLKLDIQNRVSWRENLQDKLIETEKIFKESKSHIQLEPINIKDFKLRHSEQILDEVESEEESVITSTSPIHKKRQLIQPKQLISSLSPLSPNESRKLSTFLKNNPQAFHQHPIEKIITLKEENARTLRNTLKSFSNIGSPTKKINSEKQQDQQNSTHVPLIKFKNTIFNLKQAASYTADNSPQIGNSSPSYQLLDHRGQRISQSGHFVSSLTDVELDFTKLTIKQTKSTHIKNLIDPFYEPQHKQSNRNLKQDITLDKFSPKKGYTNTKLINSNNLSIPFLNEKITQSIIETEQEEEQNVKTVTQNERMIKLPKEFQNLLTYTAYMSNIKDKQSFCDLNNFQFAKSFRQNDQDNNTNSNMIRVNSLKYSGTLSSVTTQDAQIGTYQSPRNSEINNLMPPPSMNRSSFNYNSFLGNNQTLTAISFTNLNQSVLQSQKLQPPQNIEVNKSFCKYLQESSPTMSPISNKRFRSLQPLKFTKQLASHLKSTEQTPQINNNHNAPNLSQEKATNFSSHTIAFSPQSNKIRKNLSQIVLQSPQSKNSQTLTFSSYLSKENKIKLQAPKQTISLSQASLFKHFQIKNNEKQMKLSIDNMAPVILNSQESLRQKQNSSQDLKQVNLTSTLRVSISPQI